MGRTRGFEEEGGGRSSLAFFSLSFSLSRVRSRARMHACMHACMYACVQTHIARWREEERTPSFSVVPGEEKGGGVSE